MGAAAHALPASQAEQAQRQYQRITERPRVAVVAELCRGTRSTTIDAELVGLEHGCMRVVASCEPDIGATVSADFVIADETIGVAAGYVVATGSRRGITIGLHSMSDGLHELVDDVARLRPSLRAAFLAELVEVRMRIC